MNKLIITKSDFDKNVWQYETDFTQKQYNEWLQKTATKLLDDMYNNDDVNDAMIEAGLDVYILGDIINFLRHTRIQINK